MNTNFFLLGLDGGGTGSRVVMADSGGLVLAHAVGGPSGLGLGIGPAWQAITASCREAFAMAGVAPEWSRCVLGCGLAGANNPVWLAQFRQQAPDFAGLVVESDAYTTLLGAHGGGPGVIVALGTGSVAAAGQMGAWRMASGYGFPSGDEASGAWLGLRAIVHAQQALDGRVADDSLARALLTQVGAQDRDSLIAWLCNANQTAYAALAPIVFAHQAHPFAAQLLSDAGAEIAKMVTALDASSELPVALCGGLAAPLHAFVPQPLRQRLCVPLGDSAQGALQLARQEADRLSREATR
ncbi:BadF/BadG/BcrA/BcrD ATPase family protein [Paraburkholderia bonniea]|uniref:BadF/BadG/BcrA/BcrD ATPase family protein n=1 Tax=Paraburkholderia bonniea TaxID=2152891 RepID=UPI001291B062|nr:BadF/BadG/BcrA/BcrD ATPase family protein [Paraburkholderia bonniea]WJF90402.1 BadF/BadG/BcrA/BcrD ATPase family protein [Paraburkholderia bonniea]WJF93717.1 BadF/BadG/BcrA/BcrD ATPase family protein [Paraburkholderia bonniea]